MKKVPDKSDRPLAVLYRPIEELTPNPRNARSHSKKQLELLKASMTRFSFTAPALIDANGMIIAGHGRVEAAKALGYTSIPTICIGNLTEAERRAYAIADNRLAELSQWDREILSLELQELAAMDLDFSVEITGFEGAVLEQFLDDDDPLLNDSGADQIPENVGPAITRVGDVWNCGGHRLVCGDARDPLAYDRLMRGELARMVFTDAPYNVRIVGNVGGKGKVARREFAMASGEMPPEAFQAFLTETLALAAAASMPGAIAFSCIDWRHVREMIGAGLVSYDELKNLIVWVKDNAGMGAFYRSQHEIVCVFKKGAEPHVNNFGLGETGRYRTNVWTYPGVNSFGRGRDEALALHPTVKPVAMVVDAIKDVSHRKDIVLDPFGGSGTTLIAAQKTGRRARLIELDPLYCDTICRRWEAFSGEPAVLEETGQTFAEVAAARAGEASHG